MATTRLAIKTSSSRVMLAIFSWSARPDFDIHDRGSVELHGGSLTLRGVVKKNVRNNGGELTLAGLVKGRVLTYTGQTIFGAGSLIGRTS